ncbi:hypothetical protein ACHWQZ_G002258 [Mnemiopsis leidyi]
MNDFSNKGCPYQDLQECPNQEIPKDFCSSETETTAKLLTGRIVPKFKVCNGRCDDHYRCEDEAVCHGYIYGTYCLGDNGLNYVHPEEICNGRPSYLCLNGEDEKDCPKVNSNSTLELCKKLVWKFISMSTAILVEQNTTIPLTNRTRCSAPWKPIVLTEKEDSAKFTFDNHMCSNFLDQTNCSDPHQSTIICSIGGTKSNVSKYFVCHDQSGIPALCDNGIDQECSSNQVSLNCNIHKHQLCDRINDCPDRSDEELAICGSMTDRTCDRAYKHEIELPIPFAWLKDGVEDCLSGLDEEDVWPTCGVGRTTRFVPLDRKSDCDEVFLCSHQQEAFVAFRDLCDGIDSCGNEKRICDKSHLAIPITVVNAVDIQTPNGIEKSLFYCLPGLTSIQSLAGNCVHREVNPSGVGVFGVENVIKIFLPDRKIDCDYTFGEIFVIFSCAGFCRNTNCPVKNKLQYDSCPGQYSNRIYTLADNKYLTFVTKSRDKFKNDYFICDNGFCISIKHVCNLINECGDGSDEYNCTNSLMCDSKEQMVLVSEKCDGKIDCLDFSDECNDECGREILHNAFLKGLCWVLALLATVLNMVSIKGNVFGFNLEMSTISFNNKVFILLVNIGDLLIGVYLLHIAVVDSIIYGQSYCSNQLNWLSSFHCNLLGVISTIGNEISLISVTALGVTRVIGIRNGLNVNGNVTVRCIISSVFITLSVTAVSLAIAVLPLMQQYEDFFVNGMTYKPSARLFIGSPGKDVHLDVLQEYYGKVKKRISSGES